MLLFINMSIIPLQPPRHVMNIIYGYQHIYIQQWKNITDFFLFFSVLPTCERTTQVCIIHLYTRARRQTIYTLHSHTRARVHTYTDTDTDTYTHP